MAQSGQQVNAQDRSDVKEHLSQIRSGLDKTLQDARNVGRKMMTFNADEATKLGFETIEKSIEHSRAIVNQTEKSWENQLETATAGGVR